LAAPAWCDVLGRLHFSVKDIDTEKPISAAKIVLHDPTNVHSDSALVTGDDGACITPALENHNWTATVSAPGYKDSTASSAVQADTTTDVDVELEKPEQVIVIKSNVNTTNPTGTAASSQKTQTDLQRFPSSGNSQSLTTFMVTNPGFVQSSAGAVHPRGEHASTTVDIDGVLIPGALQGRSDQLFSPEILQSVDVQTGGYAPEYGSESAAVINGSLRAGPITPFADISFQGGSFSTFDGDLTLGGQLGDPLENVEIGVAPRKFRYFINFNQRSTSNAMEAPQPDNQTAHNAAQSTAIFGNFDYAADANNTFSLFANTTPANTEIANRTGLGGDYYDYGEGYGYGGFRNADGTVASTAVVNPTGLGAGAIQVASQQADGQNITQQDGNYFSYLNWRHTFDNETTGLLSVGGSHSQIGITSTNGAAPDLTTLPVDSSLEFTPDVHREADQYQIQGSVTKAHLNHTFKFGFVADKQDGYESDQFVPGSQLALDALYATDPRLAPAGHATGATDVYGNPVYVANSGASAPTLVINKRGYYGAAYAQDTWKASRKLTANYGLRFDSYQQVYQVNDGTGAGVNVSQLSPRVNFAYATIPTTVFRASYNRLFTQPPLDEGAVLGNIAIQPETINQYDLSVERQVAPRQTAKIAAYYKDIRNQDDTGILIPYTQIGAYTTLNYQYASVHGLELSYRIDPKNNVGAGEYLSYARSHAAPGGLDQSGNPAPTVNDHDQADTVSTGLSYTWQSQASLGLDGYYGSGEASSETNGKRHPNKAINLRLLGGRNMIGANTTLQLDVSNIFDWRNILNFDSGFSGTRFESARSILLTAKASI
jgi:outer membrane receptor protein involved in Fe transport